jgi:transcriptional regulator with XRE-family HTH domain
VTDQSNPHHPSSGAVLVGQADLTGVVAYNLRAARTLRGWTQRQTAERLSPYLGYQLTQAGISALERAGQSRRAGGFDIHKLIAFTLAFDLPLAWFLLPSPDAPPAPQATCSGSGVHPSVLGSERDVVPFYRRLRELDANRPDVNPADPAADLEPAGSAPLSRAQRREMIGAWCEEHVDDIVGAAMQMRSLADQLREIRRPAASAQTSAELSSTPSGPAPNRHARRSGPDLPTDFSAWATDRMNELGHIAMLAEAFPVEISVWDADMIVRGLICWSRDPYWKTIDPDDATPISVSSATSNNASTQPSPSEQRRSTTIFTSAGCSRTRQALVSMTTGTRTTDFDPLTQNLRIKSPLPFVSSVTASL